MKDKNFIVLYISNLLIGLGTQFYIFCLPIYLYEITESATIMSNMRAISTLPIVILGVFGGILVDRINKNSILRFTSFLRFFIVCIFFILISINYVETWQIYIIGFLLSSVSYIFGVAHYAIIPQLYEKEQFSDIQIKFSIINTTLSMVGPALASILYFSYGFNILLMLYGLSLLIAWILINFLEKTENIVHDRKFSFKEDFKAGFEELTGNKLLLTFTFIILVVNLSISMVIGIEVFYILSILEYSELTLGWIYTIAAIGGILGPILLRKSLKKLSNQQILLFNLMLFMISLFLLFFAKFWVVIGMILLLQSLSVSCMNIIYLTLRQTSTPKHLLGRVSGTTTMIMKVVTPLGFFLAGLWANFIYIPYLFLFTGSIILVLIFILMKYNTLTIKATVNT